MSAGHQALPLSSYLACRFRPSTEDEPMVVYENEHFMICVLIIGSPVMFTSRAPPLYLPATQVCPADVGRMIGPA